MSRKIAYAMAAIMAMSSINLMAAPAKPGVRPYTQPDGTVVNVQRFGDERSHVYMTEDNYPLAVGLNGGLYYATIDAKGLLQASDVLATDISRRPARAKSMLSSSQQDVDVKTLLRANLASSENKLAQSGMGLFKSTFPKTGKAKGLVFLVQYQDVSFELDDPKTYFTNLLNQKGFSDYGGTGSAADYFRDMSSGQFDPQFDVYGPVTLPENRAYYGRNDVYGSDALAHFMAIHAAEILDPEVDFSQYDTDGDGYIDNVFIFYAGEGENATGVSDTVWPHSWSLSDATDTIYKYDGVRLDSYACSNEWDNGTPDGIGTFVHEFSHVLGLPDLYDTYYTFSGTPGDWSVLDSGCYLNNSRTPCGYSAYECNALQWITPKELTGRASVELQPFRDSGDACIVNTSNEKEFFLFENRQKTGWDAYLPYHGMLIWHIDFDQTVFDNNLVNNTKNHQYVDIVEANNNTTGTETAERGYSWPGTTNKTTYTSTTTPAFKDWNGIAIDLPITDIAENGGVITFDVKGGMFDLTAPANIEVSDVTSSSFAIRWDKVNRATSYVLNIYTKDASGNKIYVDGYESLDLGDVDQYKVGYLQANTDYYLSIRSTADELESPLSDELVVSTTAFVFKEASVQTLKAENVGTDGFDAKWEALRDAVSYNLTVKAIDENLTTEQYLDFGEGTSLTIPEGWAFGGSESSTYVTAANFGKASPSLKFNKDGLSLTSPDFGKQIASVSFWCRGVNVLDTGSNLDVDVFVGDTWQTVSRVVLGDSTTVTLSDIPTGAQMLRFVFNKASGNAALDDVHVYLVEQSIGKLDGYDNLSVGNVTSYRVGDLPKDITKYSYTVTAKNASGEESLVSRSVKVDLAAGNSGVSDVKTASIGKVEYYNLQGLPVNAANLTPGLYIRRQGSSVQKVIVK